MRSIQEIERDMLSINVTPETIDFEIAKLKEELALINFLPGGTDNGQAEVL
ncbi:hypothetical protein ABE142_07400 [Paenibacillus alvei]|uniref:hypothetical protein n=1 Tax=Paenibacillus alvei TaxID=44250 RepID=UPI0018CE0E2C|nr:hypothetical protein [Paenibacillus alvei]MCY9579399.1 hypothetical protein [Paenibacillus alvei]MCY9586048.1 hypothetical protein [Paenibacillus alvei]